MAARRASESGRADGRCDNWFHPQCVGIDDTQVDMLDVFICSNCESTTSRRTSYRRVCKAGCGKVARSTSK